MAFSASVIENTFKENAQDFIYSNNEFPKHQNRNSHYSYYWK